jgi:hypothetical protein
MVIGQFVGAPERSAPPASKVLTARSRKSGPSANSGILPRSVNPSEAVRISSMIEPPNLLRSRKEGSEKFPASPE